MQRDVTASWAERVRFGFDLPAAWKPALLRLGAAWLILAIAFARDWAAIADLAWNISTYSHIILIPAILAWLVWQRAGEVAKISPRAWWPGLVLCAGAAFLWLLGAFSGLDLARQAGAVSLAILAVPTLLGLRVGMALFFPLAYALLLVPFGEELVVPLQMITAKITIGLVQLSGIPAVIDGVFIDTPAGLFEVAEACSGVKFLIAMIALGVLIANVCFVGWKRRALFLAACVVVPILANGVRAWGTIYAAQLFGVEAAAGFDHIVYGWFFFAIVIAMLVGGAWRWFDRAVEDVGVDGDQIARMSVLDRFEGKALAPNWTLAGMIAIVGAALAWAGAASSMAAQHTDRIALAAVPGWQRTDYAPQVWWRPRAGGADSTLIARYRNAAGQEVDVFVAVYARQGEGSEAGGFGEGALMPATSWAWQSDAPALDGAKAERLLAGGTVQRVAYTWYRSGDTFTGSNARLKLANMFDRLFLRARPTTSLILSAEERPGYPAPAAVRAFHKDMGPVAEWMDRAAGLR